MMHGGGAAQVKAKARQRLDDMVDPALGRLRKLIDNRSAGVALAAVKDVLDRTGYKLPERLETDNAVTIKVEYETLDVQPAVAEQPLAADVSRETGTIMLHTNGSHHNGTTQNGND